MVGRTADKEIGRIAKPNVALRLGVYGVDADGNIAIPTLWADLGNVRDAADPSGDTTTDPSLPVWAKLQAMIGDLDALDTVAKNNLVAAVNEALTRGGGDVNPAEIQRIVEEYLAANPPKVTETDPTVPPWAKQPQKPTYTADEVHALPDTYTPPDQTAQQVGADPAGTAATAVSQHNTDTVAHNDLRIALQELANRVNAALDSDDTTLDQMSEVVAYIKSNKSLIDAITTSKVSVSDIVNDLVTNVADKPLSAAQGVALKSLIDELRTLIPEAYTLPIATEDTLGGVKPVTATEAMTQPVGVDAEGRLMTKPGSGGSGISVTGATVGQTVRIAAVDNSGIPTAWEPVDLPSGGGKETWELISEGTITEEVTNVHITEDINGEPFELSKLYAYFKIEPCATVATNAQYAAVVLNDKAATVNKNANGDKTRYYQCVAVYVGCSVIVGQSMSNQSYNSAWSFDNHSPGHSSWIKEGSIKKVSLLLGNGSAGPFAGVNSEYVLYGVRA